MTRPIRQQPWYILSYSDDNFPGVVTGQTIDNRTSKSTTQHQITHAHRLYIVARGSIEEFIASSFQTIAFSILIIFLTSRARAEAQNLILDRHPPNSPVCSPWPIPSWCHCLACLPAPFDRSICRCQRLKFNFSFLFIFFKWFINRILPTITHRCRRRQWRRTVYGWRLRRLYCDCTAKAEDQPQIPRGGV